jgi:hypothetical protein
MAFERISSTPNLVRLKEQKPNQYVQNPDQLLALQLAAKLSDQAHLNLYMRLCKTVDAGIINQALSFVIDSQTTTKGKLFMWKIKQLRTELKKAGKLPKREIKLRPRKKKPVKPTGLFD